MVIAIRTFFLLLVISLGIWFLGAYKVFSIKDDATDFSLNTESSEIILDSNPNMNAYFGDLHVHTKYSFDAFIFGTTASPDDAYRYAKEEQSNTPRI